jgi:hypothetical protein
MGRARAGNEAHMRKLKCYGHFHGQAQMAVMDRVEGATQDTHRTVVHERPL